MARGSTQNLYLQIGANADGLTRVAKAARITLADLGAASGDLQKTMAENFRKLGGNEVAQSARQIEATYRRTFANIRAAAEETLSKPVSAASIVGGNISGAQAQLATARAAATAYQELADAQTRLVQASGGANAGERELATILTGQALAAKESVVGLEQQLTTLRALRSQLGITTDAEEESAASHSRMGASGLIAEHVIRSFSDSVAAGQSPVRALTMEMGRITEAMTLYAAQTSTTEGVMGKFAAFMGSGWGLAISVAVAALVPLIQHLFEGGDASDSMKGKVLSLVDALSAEKFGTEAATKALQDYNSEKQRARDNDSNEAQRALTSAQQRIKEATARRDSLLAQAKSADTNPAISFGGGTNVTSGVKSADLRAQAAKQQADIDKAQQVIRNAQIDQAQEAAKAAADPIEAIHQKYKQMADTAIEAAGANTKLAASLQGVLIKYALQEAAAIKAEQAKQRLDRQTANDNRQFGRQIDLSQAEAIVKGFGGRVTSAYRSTAEQQVLYDRYKAGTGPLAAKPGTSLHESGQALDIAKGANITLAVIRRAFEAQGVKPTELLDEGNHYHVGFGPKGPSADTLARRQQAADRKDANDDRAFQGQMRQAQDAYSQALLGLGTTTEQRYQISIAQLRGDLALRDKQLDDQVAAGSLTTAEALQLKVINGMTEQLDEQKSKREEMTSLLDQQLSAQRGQIQADLTLLQLRQQGATGRADQYDLARQVLAKQQEDRRAGLAQRINNAGSNPEDAEQAVRETQNLPAVEAQESRNLNKQYQSPLDSYKDQLKSSVGDMNDALQGVEVDGLKGLENGLAGIVTGTMSVKQAFKQMAASIISDLARIAIEKLIVAAIGGGFGLKDGGAVPGFAWGGIPGYAAGVTPSRVNNMIRGAGNGRSDSIMAVLQSGKAIRVSNGESIVNAKATRQFWPVIDAMNKGKLKGFADGGQPVPHMATLSSADVRQLRPHNDNPVVISVEEGALFRPVVNGIAAQHAALARETATESGANLALERNAWNQGRKLGGTR